MEIGDMERIVFPRSATKPLQCLALASLKPDLSAKHYSVICSSHNGQREHVEAVKELLQQNKFTYKDLVCGGHWSLDRNTSIDQIRSKKKPGTLLSNCSGKHSGMILLSKLLNKDPKGYELLDHPVQKKIIGIINKMIGEDVLQYPCGVDGCGVPAFSAPIKLWAKAFSNFASGKNISKKLFEGCQTISNSIASEPLMIAGNRRICTAIAKEFGNSITGKMGAEGVYICSLNDKGLGLCLKARDGSNRAAEFALGFVLENLGYEIKGSLQEFFNPSMYNWSGKEIGHKSVKVSIS